jgi:hypothetical protein
LSLRSVVRLWGLLFCCLFGAAGCHVVRWLGALLLSCWLLFSQQGGGWCRIMRVAAVLLLWLPLVLVVLVGWLSHGCGFPLVWLCW